MRKCAILTSVLTIGIILCAAKAALAQMPSPTGHWRSNSGGNYYIHVVGERVYWLGESADGGASWTHVAIGVFRGDQLEFTTWADVTKGRVRQQGSLVVRMTDANHLVRVQATGGFGDTSWTRVGVPPPPAIDLTGVWRGNDGGTYYIRQIGNRVYWLGESGDGGRSWTNIAMGSLSGNHITFEWGDVTKGATRNQGRLVLRVDTPNHMVRTEVTGGFGGSDWRR